MTYQKWTKQEDKVLRAMFADGKNDTQIAEALGRTAYSVRGRRKTVLKLRRQEPATNWTPEDNQFLCDHYQAIGGAACAEYLGRSLRSVGMRASYLGITRRREPKDTESLCLRPGPIELTKLNQWCVRPGDCHD